MAQSDEHADYIKDWVKELKIEKVRYLQPILSAKTLNFLKHACEYLQQDNHVFIMSCDILEEYLYVKIANNENITYKIQFLLALLSLVSKHVGQGSDISHQHLHSFYYDVKQDCLDLEQIKNGEIEILKTLQFRLPLKTVLDDLKLIFKVYIESSQLRVDLLSLCEDILCLFVINRRDVLNKVKICYQASSDAVEAFRCCVTNKFYVTVSVILTAIESTLLRNFFDLKKVVTDLGLESQIHPDHFMYLSKQIKSILAKD